MLSCFFYPGLDFLWATRWVFLEKQGTLTLPVHLIYVPSCSFTFVTLNVHVLFWLFHVLCCVCLKSSILFFWKLDLDYLFSNGRIFLSWIIAWNIFTHFERRKEVHMDTILCCVQKQLGSSSVLFFFSWRIKKTKHIHHTGQICYQ